MDNQSSPNQDRLLFNEIQNQQGQQNNDQQQSRLYKCNMFIYQNYLTIIIIMFSLVFVMIPGFLLFKRREHYVHIKQSNDLNFQLRSFVNRKNYRFLVLNNDLRILLINDYELNRCGAALKVEIGSANEPADIPGLAHFLEHMLFFGSQKYTSANLFFDFVGKNQGSTNAFTDDHSTTYYFEINENYFDKALDIWSRFFIDPLFNTNQVEKEVNAVNNEYEQDLMSNTWRYMELIRRVAHKDHPIHKFYIGNTQTLKTIPSQKGQKLEKEVKKLFDKYYSSNLMSLVIIGPIRLDELEQMVVPKFNFVKNRRLNYNKINNITVEAFKQNENLAKFIWYMPIGNYRMLSLFFYIKLLDQKDFSFNEQKKAIEFILKMINTDNKNGFRAYLREKNFASFSRASYWQKSPDFIAIDIDISVTQLGMDNIVNIVQLFFEFVVQVQQVDMNIEKFKEIQLIQTIKYMYQDRVTVDNHLLNYLGRLSTIKKVQEEDFLVQGEILYKYNQTLLNYIFENINIDNGLIVVASDIFEISKDYQNVKFQQVFDQKDSDQFLENGEKTMMSFREIMRNDRYQNGSQFIRLDNVFNNIQQEFNENQHQIKEEDKFEHLDIFQFLQKQVISRTGHFYKKHKKNRVDGLGLRIQQGQDQKNSSNLKKMLDTFDPYMNIFFSTESIQQNVKNYLKDTNKQVFKDYQSDENRFIPEDLLMTSNCYRNGEGESQNIYFKMNIIKKQKYLEQINDLIEKKYDTNEINKLYLDYECHLNELKKDIMNDQPVQIIKNNLGQLWSKLDRTYLYPKASLKVMLKSQIKYTKVNQLMSNLLMLILGDKLKEELFDASLMGYQLNMGYNQKGFEFQVSGFSDKIDKAMEIMVNQFITYNFTEADFSQNKEYLHTQIQKSKFQGVIQNILDVLNYVIIDNYNLDIELESELDGISYESLSQFRIDLLKNANVYGLEVGNVKLKKMSDTFISIQNELAAIHKTKLTTTSLMVDQDMNQSTQVQFQVDQVSALKGSSSQSQSQSQPQIHKQQSDQSKQQQEKKKQEENQKKKQQQQEEEEEEQKKKQQQQQEEEQKKKQQQQQEEEQKKKQQQQQEENQKKKQQQQQEEEQKMKQQEDEKKRLEQEKQQLEQERKSLEQQQQQQQQDDNDENEEEEQKNDEGQKNGKNDQDDQNKNDDEESGGSSNDGKQKNNDQKSEQYQRKQRDKTKKNVQAKDKVKYDDDERRKKEEEEQYKEQLEQLGKGDTKQKKKVVEKKKKEKDKKKDKKDKQSEQKRWEEKEEEMEYSIENNLMGQKGNTEIKSSDNDNKILKLDKTETLVYRQLNKKKDDLNHGILNYYQIGLNEKIDGEGPALTEQRKQMILSRLVQSIIGKQAFSFLRTEHQLGYTVYANYISFENVDGIYICVQGSNKNPQEMDEKIELFLLSFMDYLKNKSENEYRNAVQNAMIQLKSRDSNLDVKLNKFWKDIINEKTNYNKQQIYTDILKGLGKQDFIQFYQKYLLDEPRKLSIQIYSQQQMVNSNQTVSLPTETNVEYNGRGQKVLTDLPSFKALDRYDSALNKLLI